MGASRLRTGLPEIDRQKGARPIVDPDQPVASDFVCDGFDSLPFAGVSGRSSAHQRWSDPDLGRQGGYAVFILRANHHHDSHRFREVGRRLQWIPKDGPARDIRVNLVLRLANASSATAGKNDQRVDRRAPFCGR